jgi:hypothetical protein
MIAQDRRISGLARLAIGCWPATIALVVFAYLGRALGCWQ